jgi:hypothetical protein
MKQYLVDELRVVDYTRLKACLDGRFAVPNYASLYWVPVEPKLYSPVQKEHSECQPFYFALELQPQRLACELLVRSRQHIRCQCIQYATEEQRNWLIQMVDGILEQLGISV